MGVHTSRGTRFPCILLIHPGFRVSGRRPTATRRSSSGQAALASQHRDANLEVSTSSVAMMSEVQQQSALEALPPPAPQLPYPGSASFSDSFPLPSMPHDRAIDHGQGVFKNELYDHSDVRHLDDLAWTLSQHISPAGRSTDGSTPLMQDGSAGMPPECATGQVARRPASSSEDGGPRSSQYRGSAKFYSAINPPELQVEDVASWSMVGRMVALYLRYMHTLFPMVHAPTFSKDLTMRRDLHDRQFRAFVLGLVSYIIGQSPLNRLLQLCSRSDLARLQKNCHAASMLLHDRQYTQPGLMHVGTLIQGYFYSASVGLSQKAGALLAEACELVHALQLGEPNGPPQDVTDFRELNTRRRVYYHVFAVDA